MAEITYILPVRETIATAWRKVKGAKATFWVVLGLLFAVSFGLPFIGGLLKPFTGKLVFSLIVAIATFTQLILSWSVMYMGIERAADRPISASMLKYGFDVSLFFKMIGLYILQMLIFLPTVLLPAIGMLIIKYSDSVLAHLVDALLNIAWDVLLIYLIIRMFLGKAIVIAEKLGPWAAIKKSFHATRTHVWHLTGFLALILLITLLSCIPLGIGLIWGLPLTLIAYGLVYRRLVVERADI